MIFDTDVPAVPVCQYLAVLAASKMHKEGTAAIDARGQLFGQVTVAVVHLILKGLVKLAVGSGL